VVWIGIISLAWAQEPLRKLMLDEALQTALRQHPSLTRVDYQTAAAEARVRQARAGVTPILTIQGSASDGPTGAPARRAWQATPSKGITGQGRSL
jgi:outer membrane protein TolC